MNTNNTLLQEAQQDAALLEDLNQNGFTGETALTALKAIKLTEADMGVAQTADDLIKELGI